MARALEEMPRTKEAAASAEISFSAARVLAAARETDNEAFTDSEPLLVEAAIRHDMRDLQRVVAHWRNGVESRQVFVNEDDPLRERRHLHISPTVFGMVRIDGDLDPETGETVLTALGSCVDAEVQSASPEDRRSPAQRRADALGEICRQWLDTSERPTVGGERPHIMVTMQLEALQGRSGDCDLEHVGPVRAEVGRRLACDSTVSRVILDARSEPLDIGRRTPVVPAPMRRALIIRDKGCRFPGCDRPPAWCDDHHVVHWADGGATALSDLVLLCRRHHRSVHHDFTVEMDDGRPVFRRPDGTVLGDRAPP